MKKLAIWVSVAGLVFNVNHAIAMGHGKDERVSVEKSGVMDKRFIGSWKVIGCMLNKVWLPREIFMMFRYEISDGAFKIHWADLSFPNWTGSFPKSDEGQIQGGSDGRNIAFIPSKGPHAGKVFKGIYELDHDVLKANFAFPGHPRPTSFDAKDGEVYEIWQRVHKSDDLDME